MSSKIKTYTCNVTDWNVIPQRLFSVITVYVENIFATIKLGSFFTNIDENEVCSKNINWIFQKINSNSPSYVKKCTLFVWLIKYFEIRNLLCDQIIVYSKNSFENKNHDVNENFKETIKFGAYIFLHSDLKKNCKCKYHDVKEKSIKWRSTLGLTSKTWTWTVKNHDPEKPESLKTWILWEME